MDDTEMSLRVAEETAAVFAWQLDEVEETPQRHSWLVPVAAVAVAAGAAAVAAGILAVPRHSTSAGNGAAVSTGDLSELMPAPPPPPPRPVSHEEQFEERLFAANFAPTDYAAVIEEAKNSCRALQGGHYTKDQWIADVRRSNNLSDERATQFMYAAIDSFCPEFS